MLSYQEALNKVLKSAKTSKIKSNLNKVENLYLASDIKAKKDNPYFNNSLLDGFAFKSSDTNKNQIFKIKDELAVGEQKHISYEKNTCYRISTGGKIIPPFDCMLPYEKVIIIDGLVQITKRIKKNENVRLRGSDFKKGRLLINKNKKITPSVKLLIKSSGNKELEIYDKPNLVLFSSGDEITDKIEINEKVINSIPEYFQSYQNQLNFNFKYLGIVKDNQKSIKNIFSKIKNLKNTIIVSTGGVSAGHKDYFPKFLKSQNFNILFHKIKMQPGRPTLFAKRKSNYYFGLPGNPISTITGFHFLIAPMILAMQNQKIIFDQANLLHSYDKNPNLTQLRRGFITNKGIKIIPDQESYKINSLVKANCWLLLDQKSSLIKKGELIKYVYYEN